MEKKKTPRRSRASRTTSAVSGRAGSGQDVSAKHERMDEKEEQARLDAASVLFSLRNLPPIVAGEQQGDPVRDQNSLKSATPPVTYITSAAPGSGKSSQVAPSSGVKTKLVNLNSTVDAGNGSSQENAARKPGRSPVNNQLNQLILSRLMTVVQQPSSATATDPANMPQLGMLDLLQRQLPQGLLSDRPGATGQTLRSMGAEQPLQQAKKEDLSSAAPVVPEATTVLSSPVIQHLPVLLKSYTSGVADVLATVPVRMNVVPNPAAPCDVRPGPGGAVSVEHRSSTPAAATTSVNVQVCRSQTIPGVRTILHQAASVTNSRTSDSSDNNLPLKKRRLIGTQYTPVKTEPDSTRKLGSGTSQVLMGRDMTSHLEMLDTAKISSLLFPSTKRESNREPSPSLPPVPSRPIKEESRSSTVSVDPRASLVVLSQVKMALTPDEDGDLPLHIAVAQAHVEASKRYVELMSMSGKSVDRYNKTQQTPLHLAILVNQPEIVRLLLEVGANSNLVDRRGYTCHHLAVREQHYSCLQVLVNSSQHECDLNLRNYEGNSPCHTAVKKRDLLLLRGLVEAGADINAVDGKSGRSVLFHAVEEDQIDMVEYLQHRGANIELSNYAGVTPLMSAQARNSSDISTLLLKGTDGTRILDDLAVPQTKKMAIPRIPSKAAQCVGESGVARSRSASVDDTRHAPAITDNNIRSLSHSSRSSPIDLSLNKSSPRQDDGQSDASQPAKGSSKFRESHAQIVAALEGRASTPGEAVSSDAGGQVEHVANTTQQKGPSAQAAQTDHVETDLIQQQHIDSQWNTCQNLPSESPDKRQDRYSSPSEVRVRECEVRGQESEVGGQESEVRGQDMLQYTAHSEHAGSLQDRIYPDNSSHHRVVSPASCGSGGGALRESPVVEWATDRRQGDDARTEDMSDSDMLESDLVIDESSVSTPSCESAVVNTTDVVSAAVAGQKGDYLSVSQLRVRASPSPLSSSTESPRETDTRDQIWVGDGVVEVGNLPETAVDLGDVSLGSQSGTVQHKPDTGIDIVSKGGNSFQKLEKEMCLREVTPTLYYKVGESYRPVLLEDLNVVLSSKAVGESRDSETCLQAVTSSESSVPIATSSSRDNQSRKMAETKLVHTATFESNVDSKAAMETELAEKVQVDSEFGQSVSSTTDLSEAGSEEAVTGEPVTRDSPAGVSANNSGGENLVALSAGQCDTVLGKPSDRSHSTGDRLGDIPCPGHGELGDSILVSQLKTMQQCNIVDDSTLSASRKRHRESEASPGVSKEQSSRSKRLKLTEKAANKSSPNSKVMPHTDTKHQAKGTDSRGKKPTVSRGYEQVDLGDMMPPNLTLMSFPQVPRAMPTGAQSAPSQRSLSGAFHRGAVGTSEGTLTRVSAAIKNRLSKALKSPQRNSNPNRQLAFQEGDSRFPHLDVQAPKDT